MPELGAVGDACVEAILPCPAILEGKGNVVTGVFAHEADPDTKILSVTFANGAHIKGVTDNHPFFSVDLNEFVDISERHEGETVKVTNGITQITKIETRYARPGEMLYNPDLKQMIPDRRFCEIFDFAARSRERRGRVA